MDGDEIGFGQDLFQCAGLDAHAGDIFRRDERIEADHAHHQSGGAFGDDAADVAEADDADGLVAELDADKFIALPLAALERGRRLGNMARHGHHQRNGMLAGGNVVAAGGVHDDDTALGSGVGVDVFIAHAGAANDLQIGCRFDQLGGDLGAAADHPAVVDARRFF